MDINNSLKVLGLSDKESNVYLDLLLNGESQTGKICKRTNIPSSFIYTLLNNLIEKGLINYKLSNNIKIFRASNVEFLLRLAEEKQDIIANEKNKIIKFISNIKKTQEKQQRFNDFKYFSGISGIKSLYSEVMSYWKQGDEYYVASAPLESFKKLEAFFVEVLHKKRIKDNVKIKIILNRNSKKYGDIRKDMSLSQVRYLDIDTKTEYGVLNDYFFLISYGDEPYGLLIKDINFASTYKTFFDLLWNQAKPQ